jgi:8-oxo-dGTP diphosphatase
VIGVVVAAALIDPGPPPRVLAAQRAHPPALAGRWELPGGKVDDGETELQALVRECHEELGVDIAPGARLGNDVAAVGGELVLRVWEARIVTGTPVAREHRALRWLRADELDDVDWLEADRPVVAELSRRLAT